MAHGIFLTVNHLWRRIVGPGRFTGRLAAVAGWLLTFVAVVLAWVMFRADSVATAWAVYRGMFGLNGIALPEQLAAIVPGARQLVQTVGTMPTLGEGTIMGVLEQFAMIALGLGLALFGRQARHMSETQRLVVIGLCAGFLVNALFFAAAKPFMYFQF
jgi:hypothetical protein